MSNTYEGTYGSSKTPCSVYEYKGWYCVGGSSNVNRTTEDLYDGVDVEELSDYDFFTAGSVITSEEELIEAVNS